MSNPKGTPENLLKGNSPAEFKKSDKRPVEAGIKSQEVQRETRTYKKIFNLLGGANTPNLNKAAYKKYASIIAGKNGLDVELTNRAVLACVLYRKALDGDINAIREVVGMEEDKNGNTFIMNNNKVFIGSRALEEKNEAEDLKVVEAETDYTVEDV